MLIENYMYSKYSFLRCVHARVCAKGKNAQLNPYTKSINSPSINGTFVVFTREIIFCEMSMNNYVVRRRTLQAKSR